MEGSFIAARGGCFSIGIPGAFSHTKISVRPIARALVGARHAPQAATGPQLCFLAPARSTAMSHGIRDASGRAHWRLKSCPGLFFLRRKVQMTRHSDLPARARARARARAGSGAHKSHWLVQPSSAAGAVRARPRGWFCPRTQ